jgi:hypothetical protein
VVVTLSAVATPGTASSFGYLTGVHLEMHEQVLPGNVLYLSLSMWIDPTRTMAFIEKAFKEHPDASGVVFDIRGNPGDYDRWARNGLPNWTYKDCLPYFKRTESWQGGESECAD